MTGGMSMSPSKAVFLDRDGVINRDSPAYIKSWREFEFLPGSLDALRLLHASGWRVIVVTNQSALARRLISQGALETIHRRMQRAVAGHGGRIADIFFCPHLPGEGCACRKPKTGMLEAAARKHDVDLGAAAMVGDSAKDILCARRAGVARAVLVRTGNGIQAEAELAAVEVSPDFVAADLLEAACWLLGRTAPMGDP